MLVLSTVALKFRAAQHKKAELGLACWNVLISFWEVNLRQLKLEFVKDSKSGAIYVVVDGANAELFTTTTEGVKAKTNDKEKRAYVLNGFKLTACGNNNKNLYVIFIIWQFLNLSIIFIIV